jgi:plasmid stability protein
MPTVIVENVPLDVYERLQKRAAAERRSLPEETLHLLTLLLQEEPSPTPRLPDFIPGEEISAPCDLPRSSEPVLMAVGPFSDERRLPDPITEEDLK